MRLSFGFVSLSTVGRRGVLSWSAPPCFSSVRFSATPPSLTRYAETTTSTRRKRRWHGGRRSSSSYFASPLFMTFDRLQEEKAAPSTPSLDNETTLTNNINSTFDPLNSASSFEAELATSVAVPGEVDKAETAVAAAVQDKDDGDGAIGLWAARGVLLLVAAIWGTNFAAVKYIEDLCFNPPCNHFPSEAALCRFGVAAAVSLPLLWRQRWDVVSAGLECGLWISLGYATQAAALSAGIAAGKCAFICSLTVVFVPLLSAVAYGKPLKATHLVAAAVALAGVAILEGLVDWREMLGVAPVLASAAGVDATAAAATATDSSALASTTMETASSVGPLSALAAKLGVHRADLLALGQPIGFGSAFARIEYYQERFKDVPGRVLTIAASQCVMVGMLSLLWVLKDYGGHVPDFGYMLEVHRLATICWTGIVTTVFAIYLEGVALQTASATDAAIAFSSEPVWAGLFGFLLLHEKLGPNAYVGGAVILTGCLIGSLSDMQQPNAMTAGGADEKDDAATAGSGALDAEIQEDGDGPYRP